MDYLDMTMNCKNGCDLRLQNLEQHYKPGKAANYGGL